MAAPKANGRKPISIRARCTGCLSGDAAPSCPMSCLGLNCQMSCPMWCHSNCCCCCLLCPFPTWCRSSGRPCSAANRQSFGLSRSCRTACRCWTWRNRWPAIGFGCSRTNRQGRNCLVCRPSVPAGHANGCCHLHHFPSFATTESARGARPDPHRRW